jgi:hypothetical protein
MSSHRPRPGQQWRSLAWRTEMVTVTKVSDDLLVEYRRTDNTSTPASACALDIFTAVYEFVRDTERTDE